MLSTKTKLLLIGGALAAAFGAGWYVQGLRWDAGIAERESAASAASEQRAETITANVITSLRIINTITQANADEKQKTRQRSETRIVYIRQALVSDVCATRPVPVDAVNRLREHADRIRAGTGSVDPGGVAD
ncbi:DUF2570 domain-containing protein [Brenneria corticis]|uniref:DUF2570 domain-containing protein n=1 Tax=Brenneria corticis TaxID=2173106 RepID=UPI00143D07E2|nr:DUF2570 domain-containing protein [Brenneria sp. CFCC 11842]